ncbi:peptidylprolyl isomerase [Methylobacterium sp. Leaf469]|uniref:SurA N-terminal domain-containing protein n=1 Tax=Methylobacterium sp. Leaf469 TaxID=1736387 RepID=UPI000701488C|nr:SurA N-terminal domain-containing protein [Methylobacterium sp. Leaf469]KQT99001.1 peptidylprolyl isomerase [Methylobacterium sp. Leaf469]
MLTNMRKASQHWLGKIILSVVFVFLIAGVAIFGVEEFFRAGSTSTVATVGKTPISAEAVRTAYQNQLQRYQSQTRRTLTPDQARALGLDRQVLAQLVSEASLDQQTASLGLSIPDAAVLRAIREEKSFQGADGKFDPSLFFQTLQRAGLNEATFVREQRSVAARLQLAEAVASDLHVPAALREAVHRYTTERRAVALMMLPPSLVGEIPAPTDDAIKTFYEENKFAFRAPETRAVNLLVLDPQAMAKPEALSPEDIAKRYEADRAKYGTPERRTIQQIVFPDEAAAAVARRKIEANEAPFEAVAAESGADAKNLTLGTLTKAELFDKPVADAAFALPKDAVSQPVKGRFGTVLLRVTAIEPETLKPLADVQAEIAKTIALERATSGIETAHDAIEDARANTKSLPEIAKDRGLPLVAVPALNAQGLDAEGNPVAGIPDRETTVAALFRSEIGGDNEPLRTKSGGYVWYDVTNIDRAHDKPLDSVRDEVVARWRAAESARLLAAKAKELSDRLDKGDTVETVAQAAGLNVETVSDIARNQPQGDLTADVVNRIFATAVGKAASAEAGERRALFKVTAATMPAYVPGAPADEAIAKRFQSTLADDVLGEYIAEVQKSVGITVNQTAFRRAVGGGEY